MTREICRDLILLSRKARPATPADLPIATDLEDTLRKNADRCVGMAANMIGQPVRIITFDDGTEKGTMFNPEIIAKNGRYETTEGCLSLDGQRPCVRYKTIKVRWQTANGQIRVKNFTGFTAQIIQHEVDHLEGIII